METKIDFSKYYDEEQNQVVPPHDLEEKYEHQLYEEDTPIELIRDIGFDDCEINYILGDILPTNIKIDMYDTKPVIYEEDDKVFRRCEKYEYINGIIGIHVNPEDEEDRITDLLIINDKVVGEPSIVDVNRYPIYIIKHNIRKRKSFVDRNPGNVLHSVRLYYNAEDFYKNYNNANVDYSNSVAKNNKHTLFSYFFVNAKYGRFEWVAKERCSDGKWDVADVCVCINDRVLYSKTDFNLRDLFDWKRLLYEFEAPYGIFYTDGIVKVEFDDDCVVFFNSVEDFKYEVESIYNYLNNDKCN